MGVDAAITQSYGVWRMGSSGDGEGEKETAIYPDGM